MNKRNLAGTSLMRLNYFIVYFLIAVVNIELIILLIALISAVLMIYILDKTMKSKTWTVFVLGFGHYFILSYFVTLHHGEALALIMWNMLFL